MVMSAEDGISILIVEDDANLRYLLETAAARAGGFKVAAALADGQEALDWVKDRAPHELPDLILTDLSMPRLTGLELLRALKADENWRHIPVAMITSSNVPNDRSDAFAAGACDFIEKPHGLEALTKVLRGLRRIDADPKARRHHAA